MRSSHTHHTVTQKPHLQYLQKGGCSDILGHEQCTNISVVTEYPHKMHIISKMHASNNIVHK